MRMVKFILAGVLGLGFLLQAGTVRTLDQKTYSGHVRFVEGDQLLIRGPQAREVRVPLAQVRFASFEPAADAVGFEPGALMNGNGTGLLGAYYSRPGHKGAVVYRVDETLDFQWGHDRPMVDLNRDYFSVRWTGFLECPVSGEYTFFLEANDGGQLQMGEALKLGEWEGQLGFAAKGKVRLTAGVRYPVRLDFYDNYGEAAVRWQWSGPGIAKAVVPRNQLYPALVTPELTQPLPGQSGLLACYYRNRFFFGDVLLRVDPQILFHWRQEPAPGFGTENFSVRWIGQLQPALSGEHKFHLIADEGVRLWLGGQLLLDQLRNQERAEFTAAMTLARNQRYDLRVEAVARQSGSACQMHWSEPGRAKRLLPTQSLSISTAPPPPAKNPAGEVIAQAVGAYTWGGSHLAHAVVSADDTAVRFAGDRVPTRISTVNVARLVFQPVAEQHAEKVKADRRGVLLKNGDFVEGKFVSLVDGTLTIDSALFGQREYGVLEVLLMQMARISDKPPAGAKFKARMEDGSVLHLAQCRAAGDKLELEDPTVGTFSIEPSRLSEIRRLGVAED